MSFHLSDPPKHSCLAVYCDHVRAVVNLFGIENVPNNYLVTIHGRTHTRDSSFDAVVLGDLVRPDETAAILLDGEEISAPVGKVNGVTIHGRSSGNIPAGCEYPFGFQALDVGRAN